MRCAQAKCRVSWNQVRHNNAVVDVHINIFAAVWRFLADGAVVALYVHVMLTTVCTANKSQ